MHRLRSERKLSCVPQNLADIDSSLYKVCFQNCRSLQKHFLDLKFDGNMLCADILGLVETRVGEDPCHMFSLDGFDFIGSTLDKVPHGISVYVKKSLNFEKLDCDTVCGIEYVLVHVHSVGIFGFVYCPPIRSTKSNLTCLLCRLKSKICQYNNSQNTTVTLIRDFHFDWQTDVSFSETFEQSLMLKLIPTAVSTDYGSCIDHIYSNIHCEKIIRSGTLESYFSDHKPLFLVTEL